MRADDFCVESYSEALSELLSLSISFILISVNLSEIDDMVVVVNGEVVD